MKRKIKQGIYTITNTMNGDCYVGQSIDIHTRWISHKAQAKKGNKYYIYSAIRKYGFDNFKFKIVELVKNKKDLTSREQFWYDKLKPKYNSIEPREQGNKVQRKPVYQIDIQTLKILNEFESTREASRKTGILKGCIGGCCRRDNHHNRGGNYYWCFTKDYNEDWKPRKINTQNKGVAKLLNGIIIETFKSMIEASRQTGTKYYGIMTSCNGKRKKKTLDGFEWRYLTDKENELWQY